MHDIYFHRNKQSAWFHVHVDLERFPREILTINYASICVIKYYAPADFILSTN